MNNEEAEYAGFLLDERESKELDYILRKELDEMLLISRTSRIDESISEGDRRRDIG